MLSYEDVKDIFIDRDYTFLNDDGDYLIAYEKCDEEKYIMIHKFSVCDDHIETVQLFHEELVGLCKELKLI